jgi:DNA-binding transcriptional regulator YiaG
VANLDLQFAFINRQKTCAIEIRRLMKKEVKDIRYNVRMTKQTFDIVDSFEGNSFTSKFET